ncbi:hypothetical protein DSECCO2_515270 [anaerobic digester metagenome]
MQNSRLDANKGMSSIAAFDFWYPFRFPIGGGCTFGRAAGTRFACIACVCTKCGFGCSAVLTFVLGGWLTAGCSVLFCTGIFTVMLRVVTEGFFRRAGLAGALDASSFNTTLQEDV